MCWCGGRHRTETQLGRRGEGFKRKIRKDVQNAGETQSVKKSTLREERSYVCVCVCVILQTIALGVGITGRKSQHLIKVLIILTIEVSFLGAVP